MSSCGICNISTQANINIHSIYLNEYNLREIFHELVQTDLPTEDYSTFIICENDANKMVEFHHFRQKLLEVKNRFETIIKPDDFEDERDTFAFVVPKIEIKEGTNEIFLDSFGIEEEDEVSNSLETDDFDCINECEESGSKRQSKTDNNYQKVYTCCFCPGRFFTPSSVRRHLRCCHKKSYEEIKENSTYTVSTMDKSMRRFECPLCHRRYNYLKELRLHLISSHQLQRKFGKGDNGTGVASSDSNDTHEKSNDFKCPKCERKCRSRNEFRKHLYGHRDMDKIQIDSIAGPSKNTEEYKCELCHGSFWTKSTFMRHFHKDHMAVEEDDGNSGDIFNIGNSSDKLQMEANKEGKFKCTLCPGFFVIIEDLQKHLYEAHCRRGSRGTDTSKRYYSERKSGDKPQMYTCVCGRIFENSKKYFNHFQYNHMRLGEGTPKRCPFCISTFAFNRPKHYAGFLSHIGKWHREEVKENESLNGMLECPDCDQLHVTSVELYRHYKSVHFTNDRDNDEGYNLDCEPCKITLKTSYEYFEHQKTVHGISNKRSVKPNKCNWCNIRVGNPGKLLLHIRSTHRQHEIRCLEEGQEIGILSRARENESQLCPICGKIMASPSFLSSHMESHNEERPFKCLLCQSSFKSEKVLKCHQREVHSEKEFKCDICSKTFKNNGARKRHLLSHGIGAVNNTCNICGKNFNRDSNLKAHMWTHEDGHPFNCHVCGKGFPRKNKMIAHLEAEHGFSANDK